MSQVINAERYIQGRVLIKEVRGGSADRVFEVAGLPRELLYDGDGKIHEGIEVSQTGDGGFVFFTKRGMAKERLVIIDRYIESLYPRTRILPKRISIARTPGDPRSSPMSQPELEERFRAQFQVPFVNLPMDQDIPDFRQRSSNQLAADSYRKTTISSDVKKEDKPVPSVVQCAECDFVGKNKRSLGFHITRVHRSKHGSSNNKEQNK